MCGCDFRKGHAFAQWAFGIGQPRRDHLGLFLNWHRTARGLRATLMRSARRAFDVSPLLIPSPIAVVDQLIRGVRTGVFVRHGIYTVGATVIGFTLGSLSGFLIGVMVSQFDAFNRLIYPYVVAFQTVPKVALAPIIIVWFGFGIWSKVAMSLLICFFPVAVNTIEGLDSVRSEQIMLMRSYRSTRWQIFRIVQLPNALPYIFAGLNVGIVLSVIGTIVGEFVGTTMGLGRLLLDYNYAFDIAGVFATLVVLSLIGVVLHSILRAIQYRLVFWQRPDDQNFVV
jgi:NitT/TauT family transport system permease protein